MNNKLSPNVKLGCSKCGGLSLDTSGSGFKFSEVKTTKTKVETIIATSKHKKPSKVVSLF